jgi:hypothetical protein
MASATVVGDVDRPDLASQPARHRELRATSGAFGGPGPADMASPLTGESMVSGVGSRRHSGEAQKNRDRRRKPTHERRV